MKKVNLSARRLLCAALTLIMVLSLLPGAALAAPEETRPDQIDLYTRWPAAGEQLMLDRVQPEAYNVTAAEELGFQLDAPIWWMNGRTRTEFVQENAVYVLKMTFTAPGWEWRAVEEAPFKVHFSNHDDLLLDPSQKVWDPKLPGEWSIRYVSSTDQYEFTLALAALPIPEDTDLCRITFDSNGGSGTREMHFAKRGSEYRLPYNGFTAPEGYVSNGWDAGMPGEMITVNEDMTLKAQWMPKDHVHDFSGPWHSNERSHYKVCSCGVTGMSGFHENDWVVDREPTEQQPGLRHPVCRVCGYVGPTEEIPVRPVQKLNTYELSYQGPWGRENLPETAVLKHESDYVFLTVDAPPSLTYRGMQFLGWAVEPDGEIQYEPGDEIRLLWDEPRVTLYGVWEELRVFTVTYKTGFGATAIEPTVVLQDRTTPYADIRLPEEAPVHKSKVFVGWKTSRNGPVEYQCGDTVRISDQDREIELIAVWEKLPKLATYKLDYQTGRGAKAPKDTVVKSREGFAELTVTDQIPVKKGFTFAGWAPEKDGAPEIQPGDVIRLSENGKRLRLYAVWEPFVLE